MFLGKGIGRQGEAAGEICFNTGLTGYQEILTDPSYAGQIITFTFPHIGNVGANDEDVESRQAFAKGLVVREDITTPSNFRSAHHLNDWLIAQNLIGICGVDTRALTRHIRTHGAQVAAIVHGDLSRLDLPALIARLQQTGDLSGLDLASEVSTPSHYEWNQTGWQLGLGFGTLEEPQFHVVAIDFGEKLNILRNLASFGCKVTVVPATATAEEILALNPTGIFLSNGPADPAATAAYAAGTIRSLIDAGLPLFGICLGHQLTALALGAKTTKMHQGHRGANHPVKNLETGQVEITSQNHGFMVDPATLPPNAKPTHVSLFDGSLEGFRLTDKPVFCVQYHPEASPGPHDSHYLFQQFIDLMRHHA